MKYTRYFAAIIALFTFSLSAQSQVFILNEPFNGTGSLNGSNGWVRHSGTDNQLQYVTTPSDFGNSLSYPGILFSPSGNRIQLISGNSEDLNLALPSPVTATPLYFTAFVKVLNTTGLSLAGDYFMHFAAQSGASGVSTFGARLFVALPSTGSSHVRFGIQNMTGGSPTQTFQTDSVAVGQTVKIVVKYDRTVSPTEATLWVNPPVGGTTEPTPSAFNNSGTTAFAQIASVCVRQGTAATGNIEIDELRVTETWGDVSLPVELLSFNAAVGNRGVTLSWQTSSETNNARFEIERASSGGMWNTIGSVRGAGTTTEMQSYTFVDAKATGRVSYRLKQVDFDGRFEYFNAIEVDAGLPRAFELAQNFPNPFNPATTISFQLPVSSDVKLEVFDLLGRSVGTIVNQKLEAGRYAYSFNAASLSSGMYVYRLQAGNFVSTRKMMLVK